MKRFNVSKDAVPDSTGASPEVPLRAASLDTSGVPASLAGVARKKPKKTTVSTKKATPDAQGQFAASIEVLTLPKGLYLFSVRNASPTQVGGLLLPAIQIGPGPGTNDSIEIMQGPGMNDVWLCRPSDKLVLKIKSLAASVMLTSIRMPEMTPLLIEVQSLDNQAASGSGQSPARPAVAASSSVGQPQKPAVLGTRPEQFPPASDSNEIPLRIVAHIQNRGDVQFVDAPWAGFAGQRLAIEGFALSPLKKILASEIEYKALSATRSETPWVSGGALCGSRGKGLPLVGFSIRLKPQPDGKRYDCEYSGTFASGKVIGPVRNGAPCWSTAPGDFLEALQVKIIERTAPEAAP